MYIEKIEYYWRKVRMLGEMDDFAETRADLLPLDMYPTGTIVYVKDENATLEARSRKRLVWVPDEK